jgi:uridine monophosphate synthetase
MTEALERLAVSLNEIGAVQFGEFRLKSGLLSPVYVDMRPVPSYPWLLREVARRLAERAVGLQFDRIAGIPYAGLPIGVALCLEMDRPLIYARKEVKQYGTRKAVEGVFAPGETTLVVDDVISTGGAKLEGIEPLLAAGLLVRDVLVVVDREQGGKEQLAAKGYALHSLFTLREMVDALERRGNLAAAQAASVREYLQGQ